MITTCVGCAGQLVATTAEFGGVALAVPIEHDVRGTEPLQPCPGGGWPGMPAPQAPPEQWAQRTAAMAAAVLALPMGGQWAAPAQPGLRVAQRSYGRAPEAEVLAGTAPAIEATLTSDGRAVTGWLWCACTATGEPGQPEPGDVYYERWTAEGREAHGWCCGTCRRLVQAG